MKYSDYLVRVLAQDGYTHCFFVAGGNVMHLLDSASRVFECVPFTHEHSAVIAAEYFNHLNSAKGSRALALVTAGPGLTNSVSALSGAWLESRENLVIGGQVKSSDLKSKDLRQLGIQELDGVEIVREITKASKRITEPADGSEVLEFVKLGRTGRKGPVFLEVCLDAQARDVSFQIRPRSGHIDSESNSGFVDEERFSMLTKLLGLAQRPVFLLGGGLPHNRVFPLIPDLENLGVPTMTTWNGADLLPSDSSVYFGRPNTWGQRSANIILQQADLLVAFGARLGLQQTGFAWEDFLPLGKIAQIDIDASELRKNRPKVDLPIQGDAIEYLRRVVEMPRTQTQDWAEWRVFAQETREKLAGLEENEEPTPPNVDPYRFIRDISQRFAVDEVIVPCSSGGAFTVSMQVIEPVNSQRIITNKGLASMGYGLAGAIGACFATSSRVVLLEGDGGFLQNLQELATVAEHGLRLKIFIFSNNGYASIRMTQKTYFGGNLVGTGQESGLRMPSWESIANAFGIGWSKLDRDWGSDDAFEVNFAHDLPWIFEVAVDENQTYFPKIGSRLGRDGSMKSNPLHKMDPQLDTNVLSRVLPYLEEKL